MTFLFWNNWLVVAFIAPVLWALVNIIDVYFAREVYEDEYDGAIVSGFFQIIPWLIVPFVGFSMPEINILLLATLGGLFFCASFFFYFKAIFEFGDASLIQIFWNLTALIVPFFAFFLLSEKLSFVQYTGILITFVGATFLSLDHKIRAKRFGRFLAIISGAILFLSLSMISQELVYSKTEFFSGFLFFTLGYFIGSLFILNISGRKKTSHLYVLSKKYFFWFVLIELINLAAIAFSQKAIDISPSVSYVAVIESFVPAFILFFSVAIFLLFSTLSLKKSDIFKKIRDDQLVGLFPKLIAIFIMGIGIYFINY